jgi:hypothetical protein
MIGLLWHGFLPYGRSTLNHAPQSAEWLDHKLAEEENLRTVSSDVRGNLANGTLSFMTR